VIRSRLALIALVLLISLPAGLALHPTAGTASADQRSAASSPPNGQKPARSRLSAERAGGTNSSHPQSKRHNRNNHHDRRQRGPSKRERKKHWREKCDAAGAIQLPKSRSCTHGPDPAPPGVLITPGAKPVTAHTAQLAASAALCLGDGQSGPRVQVLYVHAADVPSRYDAFLGSFRTWASEVDTSMRLSAEEVDASRRIRFVTTPSCEIDVQQVEIPSAADGDFDDTIDALTSLGYDREDRKYLLFLDANLTGVCGVAGVWTDDRPDQSNWNNYGPSYAQVYADCWDESGAAAHELMHTLGSVQDSAPHATAFGHCIDEYDVMCYRDSGSTPPMQVLCPDEAHEDRYDCNHDDYFNPSPPSGSYLATHWNTADNQFLAGSFLNITVPGSGATVKAKRSLTIDASPSPDLAEPISVEFRACRGKPCDWDAGTPLNSDSSAPYQATWKAPKRGTFTLRAKATSGGDTVFADPVIVTVHKPKKKRH
jgi:hypothetical protein